MRASRILTMAIFVLAMPVLAQTPPPGTTPPAKVPKVIFPTDPPKTTPTPTSTSLFPTQIIQFKGVTNELAITSRQQAQLDAQTQQLQAKYQAQYARLDRLPAAEREAQLTRLHADYNAAWLQAAGGVFTSDQLTRHQQLQLQYGGFASLTDPVAQKLINLTDAQRAQLQKDMAWSNEQRAGIMQLAQADQTRALQQFNAYNQAAQTRFNQLLNANQQQAWGQLIGTPFAFPPMFPTAPSPTVTGPGGAPVTIPGRGPGSTPPKM